MPLSDDITVYPGHGQGSACGKMMSSETTDTLGNQKKTNYALRADMSKEEFIQELLSGLTPPPGYFPQNVLMNIQGYEHFDDVLKQGLSALSPAEFRTLVEDETVIVIDTRAPQTFAKAFVPGSINIGLDGDFAPWSGTLLKDVKQRIAYVADPGREEEVVTRLSRVGFDNVLGYLAGGVEAWEDANFEVDSIRSVTPVQMKEELATGDWSVMDVRRSSEFSSEHVENAVNAPLDYISNDFSKVDPNKNFFVHCKSGYRSMVFTSLLKSKGFHNLVDVKGGFNAIKESNLFEITDYVCPTTML